MPRYSSVEVLFKRTPEGWTFNSSCPRIFGPWSTYLLTDAQKAALEERLNRFSLMLAAFVFMLIVSGAFTLFMVPDFAHQLEVGSPGAWLLACIVWIVVARTLISALLLICHGVIQSALRGSGCIGTAQPDWL